MRIIVEQVYVKEVISGRKRTSALDFRKCGFYSENVIRWVEGELTDTTEVFFSNNTTAVVHKSFDQFSAIMLTADQQDNSATFLAN